MQVTIDTKRILSVHLFFGSLHLATLLAIIRLRTHQLEQGMPLHFLYVLIFMTHMSFPALHQLKFAHQDLLRPKKNVAILSFQAGKQQQRFFSLEQII